MTRIYNFSAGPAALPEPVLRRAAEEMLDWHGSGMSVMEMSHRGKEFIAIAAEAEALLRELLQVPAGYKLLFMQGGAIAENAIVPMNLLRGKRSIDFIDTGEWSRKSIKEAQKYATVNVAATSQESGYTTIPPRADWRLDPDAAYVHICSNETIGGVEYRRAARCRGHVPLVADMSSSILSRPVDVARYGVIYGGAQKNIGPAGLDDRHRAPRPARPGIADHPVGLRLEDGGRQREHVQHPADLCDLHRRAGVPAGSRTRARTRRHGSSATAKRQRCCMTSWTPARFFTQSGGTARCAA